MKKWKSRFSVVTNVDLSASPRFRLNIFLSYSKKNIMLFPRNEVSSLLSCCLHVCGSAFVSFSDWRICEGMFIASFFLSDQISLF